MADKKLTSLENLSDYNSCLYDSIGKQWDYTITLSATTDPNCQYQGILKLGNNPSHYKFLICREAYGRHNLSEAVVVGNIHSQGNYSGYAVNTNTLYIGWRENNGNWTPYLAVPAGSPHTTVTYHIKVLFDAQYTDKWEHSCSVPETTTFMGYTIPVFQLPNISTGDDSRILPTDETQTITTNNGTGTYNGTSTDVIVDNGSDSSTSITITNSNQSGTSEGIYRFSIKDTIDSFTFVDGSVTTTYNATKIYSGSILTYTKSSDGTGSFDYSLPQLYSSDDSINVKTDDEGKTNFTAKTYKSSSATISKNTDGTIKQLTDDGGVVPVSLVNQLITEMNSLISFNKTIVDALYWK